MVTSYEMAVPTFQTVPILYNVYCSECPLLHAQQWRTNARRRERVSSGCSEYPSMATNACIRTWLGMDGGRDIVKEVCKNALKVFPTVLV